MTAVTINNWDDAGVALRSAREASGISLDDLAGSTRIPSWHLEAMEESRFDALPAPIFAVGFAKSFARAVGVSEDSIAAAVRSGIEERRAEPAVGIAVGTGRLIGVLSTFALAALLIVFVLLP